MVKNPTKHIVFIPSLIITLTNNLISKRQVVCSCFSKQFRNALAQSPKALRCPRYETSRVTDRQGFSPNSPNLKRNPLKQFLQTLGDGPIIVPRRLMSGTVSVGAYYPPI